MRARFQRLARSPNCTVTAVSAVFIAAIVVAFLFDLQTRYNSAIEDAQRSARGYAEVLAEHTARTFEAVDRTLRQAELVRQGNPASDAESAQAARSALRHLHQSSPVLNGIGWTDASGEYQAHSKPSPGRPNIADMPHFSAHRSDSDRALHITPPFRSAQSGQWITAASRR